MPFRRDNAVESAAMRVFDMHIAKLPAKLPAGAPVVARFFRLFHLFICALFFCAAFVAFAAKAEEGDATAGGQLYNQSCMVCHGVGGASQIAANPILAGQHFDYLRDKLFYYRDNPKANAAMAAMATTLGDDDINDISAYLSARPRPISGADDMKLAKSGENLYRGGDIKRNIPACAACHIADGGGIPGAYPALSGQHSAYTASALADYASGARQHSVMSDIAARLSEEDIKALAAYISGLAP
ncbi:MAG: c-type cytochrome [Gammaproteobacteria bacterium]